MLEAGDNFTLKITKLLNLGSKLADIPKILEKALIYYYY